MPDAHTVNVIARRFFVVHHRHLYDHSAASFPKGMVISMLVNCPGRLTI